MPNVRIRRRLLVVLPIAAALAAALLAWKGEALYEKVLDLRYGTPLPVPKAPPPRDRAAARLRDLDMLAQLPEVDRSFGAEGRARFAREVAALRARAPTIDDAGFFLGVAKAVALSGNAHTNVDLVSWREKLAAVPLRFAWFPEGLYVIRARAGHEALLGARVLAIDGYAPEKLEEEASAYFAGTREYVRSVSPVLLESPAALNALHPEAGARQLALRVRDAAGREREVDVDAIPPSEAPRAVKPGRLRSPVPLPDEAPGTWHALLEARAIPPSLRGPAHVTYATTLGEDRTLYLHLWQVRDEAGERIARRIDRALGDEHDPPWRRIVLDLRFDAGGDYPTVYRAIRALPRRLAPDGRLVILTDETTFSAAIITAVLAKHFAGPRAIVAGSAPGDRLAFWAEGTPARLPNSGIRIGVSTGYHDWAHGCRELRCWWPDFYYDVAGGDLAPSIPVRWTFADYARGVDTVLERALHATRGSP
ncbi:MAG TPA: hypothetical protein VLS49_05525 [Usitatibacter sp.]|nr:hypothetical protein [Usitatibacter sp.]